MQRPRVSREQGSFGQCRARLGYRAQGNGGREGTEETRRGQRPGALCPIHALGSIISCRHLGATEAC